MARARVGFGRSAESGQASVEFALVLPLLAVLTFGAIGVGLYVQQQSALTGAAFLGARAASVLGNNRGRTADSVTNYTRGTGQAWLKAAKVADHFTGDSSVVVVSARGDHLAGLMKAFKLGPGLPAQMSGRAVLPLEYTAKAGKAPTYKPPTDTMIDYYAGKAGAVQGANGAVRTVLAGLGTVGRLIDSNQMLKRAATSAPLLRDIYPLVHMTDQGEPFLQDQAVVPNPKKHKRASTPAEASKFYIGADYEKDTQHNGVDHRIDDKLIQLTTARLTLEKARGSFQTLAKLQGVATKVGNVITPGVALFSAAEKASVIAIGSSMTAAGQAQRAQVERTEQGLFR